MKTRRLLAVVEERTEASLRTGLDQLGSKFCHRLKYVASDIWKPYLNVLAERVPQAIHVLDRFHIMPPRANIQSNSTGPSAVD